MPVAAEAAALGDDLWAAGLVDRAVDATAAEQRAVRGVHDRVGGLCGDVALDEPDASGAGHSDSVAGEETSQ